MAWCHMSHRLSVTDREVAALARVIRYRRLKRLRALAPPSSLKGRGGKIAPGEELGGGQAGSEEPMDDQQVTAMRVTARSR